MDTRRSFAINNLKNFSEDILFPEIEDEVSEQLQRFVQFAEEFEGLYQLFQVFLFNIDLLTERYNITYGNYITDKSDNSPVGFMKYVKNTP